MRGRLPTVMDAQVGLAIASPQPTAAAVIPNTTPLVRPDLTTTQMETAVADMAWPQSPPGDDRGPSNPAS